MRKRDEVITLRLTLPEKEHLCQQAKLTGLRVNPFLCHLIMGSQLKAHPPEPWVDVVRQLSGIGNNIN